MLQGASANQDGRHVAVTQQTTGRSFILDLQNPSSNVVLNGYPGVNRIALSPDGRWAATGSWLNPLVKIWDAQSGACLQTLTEPARTWVTFSPDGRWLATSSSEYQLLAVGSWQPKSPAQPGLDFAAGTFTAFSPDSRVMARVAGHNIHLVDTITEKPLATLEAPGSSIVGKCQFSPDGTLLAACQIDQQVQLWDLRLIREKLVQMHLDWEEPPYPVPAPATTSGPVLLEIDSTTNSAIR
jgi:WD40 repeat protein